MTVSQMQTWWSNSNFWDAGFYLPGGENTAAGCTTIPNSSWTAQVTAQGWGLFPIFVGLQPTCGANGVGGSGHDIPHGSSAAKNAGVSDADLAAGWASKVGFGNGSVIYNDIEGVGTWSSQCYSDVFYYLQGWDLELANDAYVSGYYSSSAYNMAAMWGALTPPTEIDFAAWNYPGGNPGVFGNANIPDSYWPTHQRIHQWRGQHTSYSHGGLTHFIDSDCLDAQIDATGANGPVTCSETDTGQD